MSEYGPTPWKYDKLDDDNFSISAGWTDIAVVLNREDDPVDEARARLIAAAPDLVAALEAAYAERVNIGLDKPFWTPGVAGLMQHALSRAKKEAKP